MIGERIGTYEVLEEIGKGGMATVYRARQASVDRDVAIKVIRRAIAGDPEAVQRFQREARLIARLEHPHILPIYDFDGAHDPPYLVMRYLESGTLEEVMEQGLLPLDEVAYLLRQVCSALDYGHRQGIVHRDIKPSNIMIDQQGNAFVTDFGIARIAAEAGGRQITATGAIIGTPDYMSPEQAQGRDDIDARADIYALGAMLYHMLTGDVPFQADTPMNVLMKHIHDPVLPLRDRNPAVPPAAEAVVLKAMAKDREQRYATAVDLGQALGDALGASSGDPARLREAASTSIIRRSGGQRATTGRSTTPSEQNRQVTALYANAAEYAALVDQVAGSEAARRAMAAWREAVDGVITSFQGRILTASENDFLALWGAEAAREDDAERAVRAGLAIQSTLRSLGAAFLGGEDEALPVSIGVHSGVALLTPSDRPGSISASGSTISLANRVMQNAAGLVLVTHDTYRHVRGVFDVAPDLPVRIRGRASPVQTYRILAAKPRAFRVNTRGVEGVETRMVGREAELKHLQNAFLDAFEDGEAHVVTISGEAGVGKSRLLYEFAEWSELRPERYFVFRGRATPESRHLPFALLRDIFAWRFAIQDDDPPQRVIDKLEQGIAELSGDVATAHLLGSLCGYDLSASPHVRPLLSKPEHIGRQAKNAVLQLFLGLARKENVSLQLEDVHHADDASLDLLNDLFLADAHLKLLAVCVARPTLFDRRPDWGRGQATHTRIDLRPLDKRESRSLVQEILKKVDEVPRSVRDLLVERAEGNPYYLEELVKMLIDDHVVVRESDERWRVEEARLGALEVPPTLYGLLEARLDTLLAPEKLTLQRAAVFGRVFYDRVLEAMDAVDEVHVADLPGVLQALAKREFVFKRETSGFANSQEYIFGQAMLRDTIYERLLDRPRRAYHVAAAKWLAERERPEEHLPQIAEHFERGGSARAAADALRAAADHAAARGLYHDAERLYERALLHIPPEEAQRRYAALFGLGKAANGRGDLPRAEAALDEALAIATAAADDASVATIRYQLSLTKTNRGDYAAALGHLDAALPLARTSGQRSVEAEILYGRANTLFRAGKLDEARRAAEECIPLARDVGDPILLAEVYNRLGTIVSTSGNDAEARQFYQEGLRLSREADLPQVEVKLLHNLGLVEYNRGDYEAAVVLWEKALAMLRAASDIIGVLITTTSLASAEVRRGNPQKARPLVAEGLRAARLSGSPLWMLGPVLSMADIEIAEGNVPTGLRWMGLVRRHPTASADVLQDVDLSASYWRDRLRLTDEHVRVEMEGGRNLDLVLVFEEIAAKLGV